VRACESYTSEMGESVRSVTGVGLADAFRRVRSRDLLPMKNAPTQAMAQIDEMVDQVLSDETSGHIVIGPLVWQPDKAGKKIWYIVVARASRDGFRTDRLCFGDDPDFADQCRASIISGVAARGPRVVYVMHDELATARLCEAIWPCEKTRGIRADIEAERREWAVVGAPNG
jgi:hypothetical protein